MSVAVLVGTLDTKGREYEFVKEQLTGAGVEVVLIDVGILRRPAVTPDVSADEVSRAAGVELADLQSGGEGADSRKHALETMQFGATKIVLQLRSEGRCDAILGLGGSGGSALISGVMRELPFGVPKLLVSTMASGNVSSYIGSSDMCIMHSVTDIAGLNKISKPILANAAGAVAGMLGARRVAASDRPAVGVTMLGVTTQGALRVIERLDEAGYEGIVFHAVGSGGRALEALVGDGILSGVIDFTTKEITDELFGGVFSAGDQRLRTAGRVGIPQVVVPGAIEVLNFGAFDTVPAGIREQGRPLVRHNADVTAVRLTKDELVQVAGVLAGRINESNGPVAVVIPTKGFDAYDSDSGPFSNPPDDAAFIDALQAQLDPQIVVTRHGSDINDPAFADVVVRVFLELAGNLNEVDE